MNKLVIVALFIFYCGKVFSQELGPEDTLFHTSRTFGTTNELVHVMDGFSSSFFFQPQHSVVNALDLLQPGLSSFSTADKAVKPFLFSALPHLGFGFGFGAQGSQILRLDYEQAFAHQTLLNLRYDRWQRTGFIRSDDLRFSGLQLKLYQKGRAHELQVTFDNASDDRQWSGGIADYTQLTTLALDLISVLKEQAYTQKNSYSGTIDLRYRLLGDSIRPLNLASYHAYNFQQRIYNEIGNLAAYYPQTFLNADTCTDTFRQVYFDNRFGLNWSTPKLNISSLMGVKQRQWADASLQYDTLELNWNNQLIFLDKNHAFEHENTINLVGAGQGLHFNSSYAFGNHKTLFTFRIKHRFSNEWPVLLQRTYLSNLTNYNWSNPQKEKLHQIIAAMAYGSTLLNIDFNVSLASYESIYRFDMTTMSWNTNTLASVGQLATFGTKLKYCVGPLKMSSSYEFLAQNSNQFLPKHRAALALQWSGGIFKDQRLKVSLEGQLSYQSKFQALVFLPFIESLDWSAIQNTPEQNGFLNAQVNMALEVKTFRFFINVANLGSYWNQSAISMIEGYPFAPMQIRIGLTWDFWN